MSTQAQLEVTRRSFLTQARADFRGARIFARANRGARGAWGRRKSAAWRAWSGRKPEAGIEKVSGLGKATIGFGGVRKGIGCF